MTIAALKEIVARSTKETALSAGQFIWFKFHGSKTLEIESKRGKHFSIKKGDLYGMRMRTDNQTPQLILSGMEGPISISHELAEALDKNGKQAVAP